MNRILPICATCILLLLTACTGDGKYRHGDIVITNANCFAAASNEDFGKLNEALSRNDDETVLFMIAWEQAYFLQAGTQIRIERAEEGKVRGELLSGDNAGTYVIVASESVSEDNQRKE